MPLLKNDSSVKVSQSLTFIFHVCPSEPTSTVRALIDDNDDRVEKRGCGLSIKKSWPRFKGQDLACHWPISGARPDEGWI